MEAQFAGEMAYLKLHHKERMEEMQAQHNSEVCKYISKRMAGIAIKSMLCVVFQRLNALFLKIIT